MLYNVGRKSSRERCGWLNLLQSLSDRHALIMLRPQYAAWNLMGLNSCRSGITETCSLVSSLVVANAMKENNG